LSTFVTVFLVIVFATLPANGGKFPGDFS